MAFGWVCPRFAEFPLFLLSAACEAVVDGEDVFVCLCVRLLQHLEQADEVVLAASEAAGRVLDAVMRIGGSASVKGGLSEALLYLWPQRKNVAKAQARG